MTSPPARVRAAFESDVRAIALDRVLPTRQVTASMRANRKFRQIAASIREIGLIEPLVVARHDGDAFLLLDGHVRREVLMAMGAADGPCLVATDDEAFTYNKRISRLATVQEHRMILKAIERGVPEERIARALDVDIDRIRERRKLLDGIAPEVADLLKDRQCPMETFRILKKMKPLRQIEVAELMVAMNTFSSTYAKALLAATPKSQLVDASKPAAAKALSPEQTARMEAEMERLQREIRSVETSYGPDHLNLVIARGYVASLLRNKEVSRHLERHHPEILAEFRRIAKDASIGSEVDESEA